MSLKFRVLKLGKPAFKEYESLAETYIQRVENFYACESIQMRESEKTFAKQVLEWKEKRNVLRIYLDIQGTQYSSEQFSHFLFEKNQNAQQIDFVIGGPYGIPDSFLALSHIKIKLMDGLVTSDLAWLILSEQLYRAVSIKHQTGYHHPS